MFSPKYLTNINVDDHTKIIRTSNRYFLPYKPLYQFTAHFLVLPLISSFSIYIFIKKSLIKSLKTIFSLH